MNDHIPERLNDEVMPLLPLRGLTIFPDMVMHFDVGREKSVRALEKAMASDRVIFLVAQKDIITDNPGEDDLFKIGTVSKINQILKVSDDMMRVMVEGISRAKLNKILTNKPCMVASVDLLREEISESTTETEALIRQSYELFDEYAALATRITPDVIANVFTSTEAGYLADYITQNIFIRYTEKQKILEEFDPVERLRVVNKVLKKEVEILTIEHDLQEQLQEQLGKNQKEYIVREQMKILQSELGEGEDLLDDVNIYRTKIKELKLEENIEAKLLKEVSRLSKQPFGSSEGAVIRNYLDVCIELPWNKKTKERIDVAKAKKILEAEHYGLEKVKEHILETIAVKKMAPDTKGQVLCLVGPPGVGKTSVAMSVARALNRKLVRISLGGVRDEADIRGHRKTYVGAMPGRIISAVKQAGTKNPLILLDEIDKMGSDYRGDPAAALLEVLDKETNSEFRDHFLEIPFDLSDVMFVTTANTTSTISRPLLDRMEVIELTSYTDEEKLQIAKRHLVPKQLKEHGLTKAMLKITDDAIREIAACYTRESGVRILNREIGKLCRKATKIFVTDEDTKKITVTASNISEFLGPRHYYPEKTDAKFEVGVVKGLAWTSVGGELLEVEANVVDGSGKLELTGNLGEVMKESAKAAVTYIRSRAKALGIDPEFYKNKDMHIHFPEGAVPKDGPSAGVTVTVALVSALTGAPVRTDIAMTGEITLRGRVLRIGGLKEKTMAALRNGVKTVLIPAENESDLDEIDPLVRNALEFITVSSADGAIEAAIDFSQREIKRIEGEEVHSKNEIVINVPSSKPSGIPLKQ